MVDANDLYRCGYCQTRLAFESEETLRHVVRHLGESRYLPVYHRHLELRGYDELSAHLLTIRTAEKLAGASRGPAAPR